MEHDRLPGSWGIDPVPERLRVLGTLDTGLLWGNLGVSLLVIVAGAALVPALSLPEALLAIAIGCVIGNLALAIAGAIGADARVPGMVLLRAPLGKRGSYLPTAVNVLQGIGWSVFELLIIATAAAALSDELFGFRAQWLWTLVFGAVALALALLGPIGFVRRFVRKVAVWAVPARARLPDLVGDRRRGSRRALGPAGRGRPVGLAGSGHRGRDHRLVRPVRRGLHALLANAARRVPRHRHRVPDPRRVAARTRRRARPLARPERPGGTPGGGRRRRRRRDARAARAPRHRDGRGVREHLLGGRLAPERRPAGAAGAPHRARDGDGGRAARSSSTSSRTRASCSSSARSSSRSSPCCSPTGSPPAATTRSTTCSTRRPGGPASIAAWIAGFVLYQWLFPTGPAWWVDLVENLNPPSWGIGATVPSFLVSFALAGVVAARLPPLDGRSGGRMTPSPAWATSRATSSPTARRGRAARSSTRPGRSRGSARRARITASCAAADRDALMPSARGARPSARRGASRRRRRATASTTRATAGSCDRRPSAIPGTRSRRSRRSATPSGSTSGRSREATSRPRRSPRIAEGGRRRPRRRPGPRAHARPRAAAERTGASATPSATSPSSS